MNYEIKTDKIIKYYEVEYDLEKLKEIKEKLENYKYTLYDKDIITGLFIYRCNSKNYVKRCKDHFERVYGIFEELNFYSIKYTDTDNPNIEVEYSYIKLPNLYYYIDIIINNKSVRSYPILFESSKIQKLTFKSDEFKLVVDEILNYENSYELINNNPRNKNIDNCKKYDYKGLNELYRETLKCFTFKLIARKQYFDNLEKEDGLSLKLKK